MPVAIGFHPYFQLTDSTREEWMLSVGAKTQWLLADNKIPTGETEPPTSSSPTARRRRSRISISITSSAISSATRRAARSMSVKGKTQQLDVLLGPNSKSIVLYSPNPANARGGGGGGRGGGRGASTGGAGDQRHATPTALIAAHRG